MKFFRLIILIVVVATVSAAIGILYDILFYKKGGLIDAIKVLGMFAAALVFIHFITKRKIIVKRKTVNMPLPERDTIQIVRMKRSDESKWQNAKSWLGGLPEIDPSRWPRDPHVGLPLHHIAHIDLTEFPGGANIPGLPKDGTLSFFADTELEDDDIDAAVIYTPANESFSPVTPPTDCPPLHGENWGYSLKSAPNKIDAERVFRRWPIKFILVPFGENFVEFGPAPRSTHILSDAGYVEWESLQLLGEIFPFNVPWRALTQFRQHLQVAQTAFPEGYTKHCEEIDELVGRLAMEAASQEPNSMVGAAIHADIAKLRELTDKYRQEYGERLSPIRDAVLAAFREMLNSSPEIQSCIPANVVEFFRWEQINAIPNNQFPWETVKRLMNSYKQSLNDYNNRDRGIEELKPAHKMISKWSALANKYDPYVPIGSHVESLEMDMEQLQKKSGVRPKYGGGTSALRDAASEVYCDMMVSSQDIYEKMPASIRSYFNNNRRRSAWDSDANIVHTMFGQFQMAQSSADEFGDEIPLLQLQSDEMMSWCWGDVGSIAIGISPEDLKNSKWDEVWGLFQGH